MKMDRSNARGFTLVEMSIVMAIISILSAMSLPMLMGYIEKTYTLVCTINCNKVEDLYEANLIMQDNKHTGEKFNEFLRECTTVCAQGGSLNYIDEKVVCDKHLSTNDEGEDIPIL